MSSKYGMDPAQKRERIRERKGEHLGLILEAKPEMTQSQEMYNAGAPVKAYRAVQAPQNS